MASHQVSWVVDLAKVIQAFGVIMLLIYGMYHGSNKIDDFLDIKELEVGIAQMEAEANFMSLQAVACAPCICGDYNSSTYKT